MKVLIVDDQNEKTGALVRVLVNECSIVRDDVVTASSVVEAKRLLTKNDFDLVILDALLPVRVEDEPKLESSIALLADIENNPRLRKPKQIVALTAFANVKAEVEEILRDKVWEIFHYDPTSNEWLNAIKNCVSYYQGLGNQKEIRTYDFDVCILTALPDPEENAVIRLPWGWSAPSPVDGSLFFRTGSFDCMAGNQVRVVLAHSPRMGMVSAAVSASKLIERFRPRFMVMAGICAGYKGKVNLGDVVLADPSWDYQSGKRTRDSDNSSFEPDPHHLNVPNFIRDRFVELNRDRVVVNAIKSEWQGDAPDSELKLINGPMASGSSVIDDQIIMDEVKGQQRKLVALEMEAYGVYAAAAEAAFPKPTAFALKSICDFGDGGKNDKFQKYAAYTSAQVLRIFFEQYYEQIKDLAGSS